MLYWLNLFRLENCEQDKVWGGPCEPTSRETCVMMEIFYHMYRDYKKVIDALVHDIQALEAELADMWTFSPNRDTLTPIPFSPTATKAPEPTEAPLQPPLPTPFVLPPPATWTLLARKGRKLNQNPSVKPVQAAIKPQTAKPSAKKGPTA